MSRIFLSHSSHNNAQACALRDWLAAHGWDDVFLDLDPRRGLVAGERWQEALKAAADRCEAVVFVVSPAWAVSRWCLAEFLLAKSLGKHIFGVLVEAVDFSELPGEMVGEFQVASLIGPGDSELLTPGVPESDSAVEVRFSKEGLERLRIGLEKAGLDARSFKLDLTRPRYPGLRALDTQDAAIFFGRDADIVRGMDLIRRMRAKGQRILVVLGASGSGKSSFVRAGLWPRLQRADREFLALPVVRPENAAFEGPHGLVACITAAGSARKLSRAHWREMLGKTGGLRSALAEVVANRAAGDAAPPVPILVVDQVEELFHADAGIEATRLLERLAEALRANSVLAIFSIRSDAYAHLQEAPQLEGLEQVLYSLPQLAQGAVQEVIEGPARREREKLGANGLKIDPELTDRLMRDWAGADALPLLAFTLERLVHDHGGDGRIDLGEYEASRGLGGAIEAAVAKALAEAVTAHEIDPDAAQHEQLVRKVFVPWLVRVDPETRVAERKMARFNRLPDAPLVQRLIDARLLTSDLRRIDGHEARVVEIAHEALLRQWPLLRDAIAERREELSALEQVKRDAGMWVAAGRSEDSLLHRGRRLSDVEALLARDELQTELGVDGRGYLLACRQRENEAIERERAQQERERRQLEKTRRAQRRTSVLLTVVALVIALASWSLVKVLRNINQSRSDVLAVLAADAYEAGWYERAARFALSGMAGRDALLMGFDASVAELQLARASQRKTLRLELVGHEEGVLSAAFSPDGTRVLTASGDQTARIWNAATGRELTKLVGHEEAVLSAAFSPDGTRVLTASGDQTARIWNAATGRELTKLVGHEEAVLSAVFNLDGTRVLTASGDQTARIWDATTGHELGKLVGHEAGVWSAAFSPDGTRVLTASGDQTARIWDAATGRELTKLVGHEAEVWSADFSPDNTRALTASEDRTARIWDAATGSKLVILVGHEGEVWSAAFGPGGAQVVTASDDQTARIWDAATGRELAKLVGHEDWVSSAAFNLDGTRVLTASGDQTARVWDAASGREANKLVGHEETVTSAAFSPDGTQVVTASDDQTARVWDAATGRELAKLVGHEDWVSNAAFNLDSTQVVTASGDQTARIWDAATGRELTKLLGHEEAVSSAAFSPDGTRVLTASGDRTARIWDAATGRELIKLVGHKDWVSNAAFSPNGTRVLTASGDRTARIWDAATGRELTNLVGYEGRVWNAAFSPDGTRALTAGEDRTARIWDAATGRELTKLLGHEDWVESAEFSPDGTRVLTASSDQTARIWDVATGSELGELMGHRGRVLSAAFSPDGAQVTTASVDHTARIWDTRFATTFRGRDLIDAACREVLSVNVDAEPFEGDLSRLSDKELQLAPVLDPVLDRDACRPATTWQRIKAIFGWR